MTPADDERFQIVSGITSVIHASRSCIHEIISFHDRLSTFICSSLKRHGLYFSIDWVLRYYGHPVHTFRQFIPIESQRKFKFILKKFLEKRETSLISRCTQDVYVDNDWNYSLFNISEATFSRSNALIDRLLYIAGVEKSKDRISISKEILKIHDRTSYRLPTIIIVCLLHHVREISTQHETSPVLVMSQLCKLFNISQISVKRAKTVIDKLLYIE